MGLSLLQRPWVRRLPIPSLLVLLAIGIPVLLYCVPSTQVAMERLDNTLFDALYATRPQESMQDADVVIISIDDASLDAVARRPGRPFGWPWPRFYWAQLIRYLNDDGAKVVGFDILFTHPSVWQEREGDDTSLGNAIRDSNVPLVFATVVDESGQRASIAPRPSTRPSTRPFAPILGAANIYESHVRRYWPKAHDHPSLALQIALAADPVLMHRKRKNIPLDGPFSLHYYGPHIRSDGQRTFRYISIGAVLQAAWFYKSDPEQAQKFGIKPGMFKDKIVIVGAIAGGLHDAKSAPLDAQIPGVEIQATAVQNLLRAQQVRCIGLDLPAGLLCAFLAMGATLAPRRAWLKVALALGVIVGLAGVSVMLFRARTIYWLPSAVPLMAALLATIFGIGYSYFTEDKQKRFFMKVLSQSVSPAVAAEVARTGKLDVVGQRREMTVMFTDIAGFTDMSESLDADTLRKMLNFYLEEMTGVVLAADGTVDKYIGDAIMSFWNAPLDQEDHAVRACEVALEMVRREDAIQPQLQAFGIKRIKTRIGLNTGPMSVGFTGSSKRLSYTVLGDSVNLGSRLEGTNKFYGTRICISGTTAEQVKARFLVRQLDVIRVKGKQQPMPIFELVGKAEPNAAGGLVSLIAEYESALGYYRSQKWDLAERILLELAKQHPEDGPTQVLLSRIEKYRNDPPPPEWDGVHVQTEK